MRQSGRAFRRVLRALLEASEGKNVVFICYDEESARSLYDSAKKIIGYLIDLAPAKLNYIVFPNNGSLTFRGPIDYRRPTTVIIDDLGV